MYINISSLSDIINITKIGNINKSGKRIKKGTEIKVEGEENNNIKQKANINIEYSKSYKPSIAPTTTNIKNSKSTTTSSKILTNYVHSIDFGILTELISLNELI